MPPIHICSPHVAGLGSHSGLPALSSDEVATRERVDNVRIMPLHWPAARTLVRPGVGGMRMPRAAIERMKLWENGRRLRVKFLDGLADVQSKVAAISKEWEAIANLTLDFVTTGAAEVRISFAEKDFSWSTVGTDALTVPSTKATMNYGWLEPTTPLREYQRVVRHEWGHALGMIHEHQNPAALGLIPWDKPKVYAYYAQQDWTQEDVDSNIFDVYSEESTNHTAFDPDSIMQYAVPDSLTIGSYSIGWNTTFSPADIEFMRRQYPKGSPGTLEVVVNGPRLNADLASSGELDTYRFSVPAAATHIMTTEGPSDTVLTLHGPNDAGAVLGWDDDRGKGLNARIVRKLQPGSYWLTVRHKGSVATGIYSIGVKTYKT